MTQVMKASDVRQQWSQLLNKVFRNQTRIVVEKSGIPVAAVISAEDLTRLTRLEEQRERNFAVLDEIGEKFKDIPAEEIEQEVGKALSEVRKKNRRNPSIIRNAL
ncbi:MAG: type II toxin-antitoxin system Phd/YefM family antitoxin [Candidatus Levybacteria bacterium]|nr:type II toxin-antitoxin system Phd/YefM family antitoxin [Candidatus Levybacteria bacterium]